MYSFKSNVDKVEYEAFASEHFMANLLQSANWANIKSEWKADYTAVYDEANNMIACGLLLIRSVKGMKFGYMPRGPILDYKNKELLKFYIKQLKKYAKDKGLMFIKIDPKVVLKEASLKQFEEAYKDEFAKDVVATLIESGAKYKGETIMMSETFQPRFDGVTYLSEATIDSFSRQAKHRVKKAREKGVELAWGSYEDIDIFDELMKKTMERKKVNLRNKAYFQKLWNSYEDRVLLGFAKLDVALTREKIENSISEVKIKRDSIEKESLKKELEAQIARLDKDLELFRDIEEDVVFMSGIFAIGYGDTVEMLYAGMDEKYKSFYPQYMLEIDVMQKAFDMGYKKACLGGIEGTLDDGLTISKVNYGATIVSYIGEFDIVASPLYHLFNLAWRLRGSLKKRKKK